MENLFKAKGAIFKIGELGNNKPLGINWQEEDMIDLLNSAGYEIIERGDEKVAIKEGAEFIPTESNIEEMFNREIKKIILQFLKDNCKK